MASYNAQGNTFGSMVTLRYDGNEEFTLNDELLIAVPDGYHYCEDGKGENTNWCYIVPKNVPLSENHINAKPYSFAVTSEPIGEFSFEALKLGAVSNLLVSYGYLEQGIIVDTVVRSAHCAFLYQNFVDSADPTYNKIKGFLVTNKSIYMMHIYANHNEEISEMQHVIDHLLQVGRTWMEHVNLKEEHEAWMIRPVDGEKSKTKAPSATSVDKSITKNQAKASKEASVPADNGIYGDHIVLKTEDCRMKDGDVFDGYFGKAKKIVLPLSTKRVGPLCSLSDSVSSVIIPEGVTEICENAFMMSDQLREITLPDSLLEIGSMAFSSCKRLESIKLPSSLRVIKERTFGNCEKLTDLVIPEGVQEIGPWAFYSCKKLQNIELPSSLRVIKEKTFSYCEKLTYLVIPDGVQEIDEGVVDFCKHIGHIFLPDSITQIGKDNFTGLKRYCRIHVIKGSYAEQYSIANINVHVYPLKVVSHDKDEYERLKEEILTGKFEENAAQKTKKSNNLQDKTSETEGENPVAIADALKDQSIEEPVVVKPEDYQQLEPEDCRMQDNEVFNGYAKKQTHIILPRITKTVNSMCYLSTCVDSIIIPEGVNEIKERAFYHKAHFSSITIPEGITTIEKGTFSGCTGLQSITLPGTLETIAEESFSECKNLTSIAIPESVTNIGRAAFRSCKSLENISLPTGITEIKKDVFAFCTSLVSVSLPDRVKTIGDSAFVECKSLKNIIIPETVTAIGERAFSGCETLSGIVLPDRITRVEKYTFSGCKSLKNVIIPEMVTAIGESAFSGCETLSDIVLPDGITRVEEYTFSGCKSLKNIMIPETVTAIGKRAFYECETLSGIVLPDGITRVEEYTFSGCKSLKTLVLPEGLTSIEDHAFSDCNALSTIIIPESVSNIGEWAFYGCKHIREIYLPAGMSSFAWLHNLFLFDSIQDGCTFHMVEGSPAAEKYKTLYRHRVISYKKPEYDKVRDERIIAELQKNMQAISEDLRDTAKEDLEQKQHVIKVAEQRVQAAKYSMQKKEEERKRILEEEAHRRREEEELARRQREAEEMERKRLAAEEAARKLSIRRKHYDETMDAIVQQQLIVSENRGWFGKQARLRKAAQEELETLKKRLAIEFPDGRP